MVDWTPLTAGDRAIVLEFGQAIDRSVIARVTALDQRIQQLMRNGEFPELRETIPTFRSLALVFDPLRGDAHSVLERLMHDEATAHDTPGKSTRHWHIPVCYGGDHGADLAFIAEQADLTIEDAIALHLSTPLDVYMLGFLPGYGFLGDTAKPLWQPRRKEPRLQVPAGTLAIANQLCGIYPWQSPGGWHLIGACPVPLFDAQHPVPVLLDAGDKVTFRRIETSEFDAIKHAVIEGRFERDSLRVSTDEDSHEPSRVTASAGTDPSSGTASHGDTTATGHHFPDSGQVRSSTSNALASSTTITVQQPGLLSAIQDRGRFGHRRSGIPWSGVMVPAWQAVANTLVDNPEDAPVIETYGGGLVLRVGQQAVRVAVVGEASAHWHADGVEGEKSLACNQSALLPAGATLTLKNSGSYRLAVLAIEGLHCEHFMGSASTYAKAGIGGIDGRSLVAGDALSVTPAVARPERRLPSGLVPDYRQHDIRVVKGPQFDHFSVNGQTTFLNETFMLGRDADRMGARLEGPAIAHRDAAARDIVSDAILPGSIQIPGNGQAIVLLNDAHTAGGYPKIATVLSIDLPIFAVQAPGFDVHFTAVTQAEAREAVLAAQQQLKRCLAAIGPVQQEPDVTVLLSNNLIDGIYADGFTGNPPLPQGGETELFSTGETDP